MLPGNKRRESPHCNSRLMHINYCVYYTMESIDSHILGDKWQRARIKFPFPFQDFSFAHVEKPSHIVSSFLFTARQIAHSLFFFSIQRFAYTYREVRVTHIGIQYSNAAPWQLVLKQLIPLSFSLPGMWSPQTATHISIYLSVYVLYVSPFNSANQLDELNSFFFSRCFKTFARFKFMNIQ